MATLIIRLRCRAGTKRLLFKTDARTTTWKDLQLQVSDVVGVPVGEQLISLTPVHQPSYIEAKDSASLESLGLAHGAMLYLKEAALPEAPPPAFMQKDYKKEQERLREAQKSCNHGPRGRCLNCDNAKADVFAGKSEQAGVSDRRLCNHPPGATCIHCSSYIASAEASKDKDAPAAWMCNHSDSTFCPKCLPPEEKDENAQPIKKKTCRCDNQRGEWCTECVDLDKQKDSIKHDLIPWAKVVEEHARVCQFKHAPGQSCFQCEPPEMPSYVGKPDCDSGHRPWPGGVCLRCAPANAVIRPQPYRHLDSVSLPAPVVQAFYVRWRRLDPAAKGQRAGILFGRHEPEPGIQGGVRAVVHACYEPPQEFVRGNVRFTRDPNEKAIERTARLLGLEPVGWILTAVPREGDKYHGKVFLSGNELRAAARLQKRYADPKSQRSRFVTVVVEHGDVVTPAAYQVSDQCVALQRDGVLANAEDPLMVGTHTPAPGELVPKLIYRNEVIRNGEDLLTDDFIVKVILSAQVGAKLVCEHFDFSSESLFLGREEGLRQLKEILNRYANQDWVGKLSDFLLLCFLSQILEPGLHAALCEAYATGRRPEGKVLSDLDSAMIPYAY